MITSPHAFLFVVVLHHQDRQFRKFNKVIVLSDWFNFTFCKPLSMFVPHKIYVYWPITTFPFTIFCSYEKRKTNSLDICFPQYICVEWEVSDKMFIRDDPMKICRCRLHFRSFYGATVKMCGNAKRQPHLKFPALGDKYEVWPPETHPGKMWEY